MTKKRLHIFFNTILLFMLLSMLGPMTILAPIIGFPLIIVYSAIMAKCGRRGDYRYNLLISAFSAIAATLLTYIIGGENLFCMFLFGIMLQIFGVILAIFMLPLYVSKSLK